jgi:hypothetical protein
MRCLKCFYDNERKNYYGENSDASAKADLTGQSLSHMYRRDKNRSIERRLFSAGKYEYRLIENTESIS